MEFRQADKAPAGGKLDDLHLCLSDWPFPSSDVPVGLGSGEGDDTGFVGEKEFWIDPAADDPERQEIKRIAMRDAGELGGRGVKGGWQNQCVV